MTVHCRPDHGLQAAIAASRGISALARSLGLAQPTVSAWKRVPAHRVIQIERLTGVSRRVLRPDLYDVPEPQHRSRDGACCLDGLWSRVDVQKSRGE